MSPDDWLLSLSELSGRNMEIWICSVTPHWRCAVEFLFPKFFGGTIGFRLGDGIRCLEPEAQNAVLSLEVAKIQFSN